MLDISPNNPLCMNNNVWINIMNVFSILCTKNLSAFIDLNIFLFSVIFIFVSLGFELHNGVLTKRRNGCFSKGFLYLNFCVLILGYFDSEFQELIGLVSILVRIFSTILWVNPKVDWIGLVIKVGLKRDAWHLA